MATYSSHRLTIFCLYGDILKKEITEMFIQMAYMFQMNNAEFDWLVARATKKG